MASLNILRPRRARLSSENGAEIIELVLVTPIFALIIAAMFDFGFLFRNWEIVTNAAREGARIGVLPDYVCDGTTTDVKDRVDDYMTGSGVTGAYTVNVNTQAMDTAAGTFNACVVRVELTQPLPSLSVISALTGGTFGDVPVRSSAVMRTEAQAAP
jgi:Flp pilus assembly protein TadG